MPVSCCQCASCPVGSALPAYVSHVVVYVIYLPLTHAAFVLHIVQAFSLVASTPADGIGANYTYSTIGYIPALAAMLP